MSRVKPKPTFAMDSAKELKTIRQILTILTRSMLMSGHCQGCGAGQGKDCEKDCIVRHVLNQMN